MKSSSLELDDELEDVELDEDEEDEEQKPMYDHALFAAEEGI